MSYYRPRDNVVIEGILYIPKEQQNDNYFSYSYMNKSIIDNLKNFKKMIIPDLTRLAQSIGIDNIPKKKEELVNLLESKVVFE